MQDFLFRPFGLLDRDLDISFKQTATPQLVTQVLKNCALGLDEGTVETQDIWELTLGKRIEYLLQVATLSGINHLAVQISCHNESCAQMIEIELSVEELIQFGRQNEEVENICIKLQGKHFSFRKPTGTDQHEWLQKSYDDEKAATEAMLETLLIAPTESTRLYPIREAEISMIEQAFQKADPFTSFTLTVRCPYCERDLSYETDLQKLLLTEMEKVQTRLLKEIHLLALNYQWSENQIISLPHWRRARYLNLLKQGKNE